jgi:hypothetical protein
MPYLSDKPVGEDGYYMLTVAWNIACGYGIAIRPGELTTGIQPLATFIYSLLAWAVIIFKGNKYDFIRTVIIFSGINQIIFAYLAGKIASNISLSTDNKIKSFALTFITIVSSFYIFRVFAYGLETGIYLTLFSIVILYSITKITQTGLSLYHCVIFGGLIGLTGLARIDFGVVFIIFISLLLISKKVSILQSVVIGLIALIVVFPWFIYVKEVSGAWIPSSGPAQSSIADLNTIKERIPAYASALIQNTFPIVFTGEKMLLTIIISIPLTISIFILLSYLNTLIKIKTASIILLWLLSCLALTLIYLVFFWATHFYARYTTPLLVVYWPLISVLYIEYYGRIKERLYISHIELFLVTILYIINIGLSYLGLHVGRVGNPHSISAGYIKNNVSNRILVGAFQSGVIGYYNDNIVNLDGKVNNHALAALKDKRLNEYTVKTNIQYVIDWPGYLDQLLKENDKYHIWKDSNLLINNGSKVIERL